MFPRSSPPENAPKSTTCDAIILGQRPDSSHNHGLWNQGRLSDGFHYKSSSSPFDVYRSIQIG